MFLLVRLSRSWNINCNVKVTLSWIMFHYSVMLYLDGHDPPTWWPPRGGKTQPPAQRSQSCPWADRTVHPCLPHSLRRGTLHCFSAIYGHWHCMHWMKEKEHCRTFTTAMSSWKLLRWYYRIILPVGYLARRLQLLHDFCWEGFPTSRHKHFVLHHVLQLCVWQMSLYFTSKVTRLIKITFVLFHLFCFWLNFRNAAKWAYFVFCCSCPVLQLVPAARLPISSQVSRLTFVNGLASTKIVDFYF